MSLRASAVSRHPELVSIALIADTNIEAYGDHEVARADSELHPDVASRTKHLRVIEPKGPLGYIKQAINMIGVITQADWSVASGKEARNHHALCPVPDRGAVCGSWVAALRAA